jgi:hypothetical protein
MWAGSQLSDLVLISQSRFLGNWLGVLGLVSTLTPPECLAIIATTTIETGGTPLGSQGKIELQLQSLI